MRWRWAFLASCWSHSSGKRQNSVLQSIRSTKVADLLFAMLEESKKRTSPESEEMEVVARFGMALHHGMRNDAVHNIADLAGDWESAQFFAFGLLSILNVLERGTTANGLGRLPTQAKDILSPRRYLAPMNLLSNLPTDLPEELTTVLQQGHGVRIERIVSTAQIAEGFWDRPTPSMNG